MNGSPRTISGKIKYRPLTLPTTSTDSLTSKIADATAFKVVILVCVVIVIIFLTTYFALYFDNYEVRLVKTTEKVQDVANEHLAIKSAVREELIKSRREFLSNVFTNLPGFSDDFCKHVDNPIVIENVRKSWKLNQLVLEKWLFPPPTTIATKDSEDECVAIKSKLAFYDSPLSEEERDYPLAYGALVFKNAAQVYFMLSSIYHPQNIYCIAIDSKATEKFKNDMERLGLCFPNIHVIHAGNIDWCKYSVLNALFKCFELLSAMKHEWRYFQYLSGVDLPLKTNLEMVRIFAKLNNTVNADVIQHNPRRTKIAKGEPPMHLWKSSMSALIPREAADAIVSSEKVRKLLLWLQPTQCPDETFWSTVAGNPDLQIPGGYDAESVFTKIQSERAQREQMTRRFSASKKEFKLFPSNATDEEPFELFYYYISRYQVWNVDRQQCAGKYVSESCVYGLGDLPLLLRRPELVAHKFYWDFDPAAYFCLYKAIRERALNATSQSKFRGENYSKLPLVRLKAGETINDVDFHINAFPNFHFSRR